MVVIDENVSNGTRSIIAANLGDSRAILGRNGTAVDLTQVRSSIIMLVSVVSLTRSTDSLYFFRITNPTTT